MHKPSKRLLAPARPLIPVSCAALLSGCVGTAPLLTTLSALDCASLIPPSYRQPLPAAPLPPSDATQAEVLISLDGQLSALDRANGRTVDLVALADACEARQGEVLKALQPRAWWKLWGK